MSSHTNNIIREVLVCLLCLGCFIIHAETISITDKGARGDAVRVSVNTDIHSNLIVSRTAIFSNADMGKVIEIFGAGESTTGINHQDLIATIVKVVSRNSVCVRPAPEASLVNAEARYGTDNAPIFQAVIDAAIGTNTVIRIPMGNYLLIPQSHFLHGPTKTFASVVISKGGLLFKGDGMSRTILTACGAWQLGNDNKAYRGFLFVCRGPVSNDYPLVFENLTMDGGVDRGNTENHNFPASPIDGSGWDLFHSAVVDMESGPLHSMKKFLSCEFVHWRGEILKSTSSWTNGFIDVTDCNFHDGNASAFNFSFAHHIDHCVFSNLKMAMEFYEGRTTAPSRFENCKVCDVSADLAIVGALTNHLSPSYTIRNNLFQSGAFGILLGPAENVTIAKNKFIGQGFAIGTGPGYQGTACNRNITIDRNTFSNVGDALLVQAGGPDRIENVTLSGNLIEGRGHLGCGWGWSTNVVFSNNIATNGAGGLDGSRLTGEWFLDDLSDHFPPHPTGSSDHDTNIVSYAFGARQQTRATRNHSVFLIDDSQPDKIPPQAKMIIAHEGPISAPLFLSTSRSNQAPAIVMKAGSMVNCAWTNGSWKVSSENESIIK